MEQEKRLEYKIFTRIGKKKYDELLSMLNHSDRRTMSALLRDILTHEKIVLHIHDDSLDKTMEQLSAIRKELQAIGININQVTRKINRSDFSAEQISLAQEILVNFQQTGQKIDILFTIIEHLSERWLPK